MTSTHKKIALGVGLLFFGALLTTALIIGLVVWGWGLFAEQAEEALNRNEVIRKHIGEVVELDLDLLATGEVAQENVFVFDITGTKGSGRVTVELITIDDETEEVASGVLELSTGEVHFLVPSEDE